MNQKHYTSYELSKALYEAGCELPTNYIYDPNRLGYPLIEKESADLAPNEFRSYDLIWDICIRYFKEFWGEEIDDEFGCIPVYRIHPFKILSFLQQGKKSEAERYILEHSLFFTQKS